MRCSSGARGKLYHKHISQFLTSASCLFTPSLLHRASVSATLFLHSCLLMPAHHQIPIFCFILAAYVVLAGLNGSALYSWRPDTKLFAVILRAPPARSFLSLIPPPLNTSKVLLASSEEDSSSVYQLSAVSNQSDFIPR